MVVGCAVGINKLTARAGYTYLRKIWREKDRPVVGISLSMDVLFMFFVVRYSYAAVSYWIELNSIIKDSVINNLKLISVNPLPPTSVALSFQTGSEAKFYQETLACQKVQVQQEVARQISNAAIASTSSDASVSVNVKWKHIAQRKASEWFN